MKFSAQQNGRLSNRRSPVVRSSTLDSLCKRRNTLPALSGQSCHHHPMTTSNMLTVAPSDATTLNEDLNEFQPHYQVTTNSEISYFIYQSHQRQLKA